MITVSLNIYIVYAEGYMNVYFMFLCLAFTVYLFTYKLSKIQLIWTNKCLNSKPHHLEKVGEKAQLFYIFFYTNEQTSINYKKLILNHKHLRTIIIYLKLQ